MNAVFVITFSSNVVDVVVVVVAAAAVVVVVVVVVVAVAVAAAAAAGNISSSRRRSRRRGGSSRSGAAAKLTCDRSSINRPSASTIWCSRRASRARPATLQKHTSKTQKETTKTA